MMEFKRAPELELSWAGELREDRKLFLNPQGRSRAVVAHGFNPSTREAKAGGFLSSRPTWSTKWATGQPGVYRETLSRKKQNKTKKKENS